MTEVVKLERVKASILDKYNLLINETTPIGKLYPGKIHGELYVPTEVSSRFSQDC